MYMDHCAAFGTSSTPGIFGHIADAAIKIFRHHGVQDLVKWVDDFVFFHYPVSTNPDGSHVFSYDESLFFSIADHLGWPWSLTKHVPFATTFNYNGFHWHIANRTVKIPEKKKTKYVGKLADWTEGESVTRKECEGIVGMLNHCCLAIPEGCSHLPSFYRLAASFESAKSKYVHHRITAAYLTDVAWWRT
ncbi:hypothetical protein SCP_1302850 [Sparassis crispa]|uniref:Reverse transcriptase domain-containing protein n=1 Tax=Sparassis crispa TaxID=139825 RepID=A0A401H248_9APHY|nr:hypothetical protein SCP_1302850 [Sparassis crispa]GBE88469.1 hypothetical protein SCP_1302850 [Sparassis crispa]